MAVLRFIWGILLPAWGLIALIALILNYGSMYLPYLTGQVGDRSAFVPEVTERGVLSPDGEVTALYRQTAFPDEIGPVWLFDRNDLVLVRGQAEGRVAMLIGPDDQPLMMPGEDPRFDILWQDDHNLQISYCGIRIFNMDTVILLPSYTPDQTARLVEIEAVRRPDCDLPGPAATFPRGLVGMTSYVVNSRSGDR
tara:strand:+ start:481 stop:1065 length:585 start_codon:yes stop_codon:yes gene_type:complete